MLVQFGRVAIVLVGAWVREALKRLFFFWTKAGVYRNTTGATAIHIFKVRIYFCIMLVGLDLCLL